MEKLWTKFFPHDNFVVEDNRLNLVDHLQRFFASNQHVLSDVNLSSSYTHFFDVQDLKAKLPFSDFETSLIGNPVDFAACLGLAISLIANKQNPYLEEPPIIKAAFYNLSSSIGFYDVRADTVGKMVSLEGSVARVSPSRPLVLRGGFKCFKCNQITFKAFEDGIFEVPNMCATPRCDNRLLEFDRSTATLSDYQRLRLSEKNSDHAGTIPKVLEMEVRDTLVNQCIPGDVVRIVGIVKTVQIELSKSQRFAYRGKGGAGRGFRQESGLHELYILVQSLECLQTAREQPRRSGPRGSGGRGFLMGLSSPQLEIAVPPSTASQSTAAQSSSSSATAAASSSSSSSSRFANDFSPEDLQEIRDMALSDAALYHLCAHISPQIYGQDLVKMGLLLGLMGGSGKRSKGSESNFEIRTNIHVLLVGDAGMGKSRMLRDCLEFSQRSVFVGGATSTTAGLTATVTRESSDAGHRQGTDLCVEAGALVLADSGVCCIDELDKATCDTHALLEAMEQQRVSLAKGGVVINLRSRTTIFAAANPTAGKYHKKRSVSENLRMNPALLSRFDLIFLMVDTPDEDRDRAIGEHIAGFASSIPYHERGDIRNADDGDEGMTLAQMLRRRIRQVKDGTLPCPIPAVTSSFIRKYIDYARRYVNPVLSNDAARVLQKFYLRSRANSLNCGASGLPVTLRHLESLIRLSQARAKVDLREEVSGQDAKEVVMLWTEAIRDGEMIDPSSGQTVSLFKTEGPGRRGGRIGAVRKMYETLQSEATRRPTGIFKLGEIAQIVQRLALDKDVDTIIEALRNEGRLIKKGPELFQIVR